MSEINRSKKIIKVLKCLKKISRAPLEGMDKKYEPIVITIHTVLKKIRTFI
jgi:hypothetical protein|tara:strand:- start:301 stop:453 length:153 start_codon:yes stop_codon:yes gene_type:complete